jgi:hypothetical protein
VISGNLPLHHTRTFFNGSIVIQAIKKENHITIVSSSAWKIKNKPQMHENFPRLSYETATSMYLNDSEAALRSLFSVPSTIEFWNKVKLIKYLTGWDVTLSSPDSDEKQRLTEGLRKMKKALLQASHRSLPHCSGSSTKKEELIQEIMRYHPPISSTNQTQATQLET